MLKGKNIELRALEPQDVNILYIMENETEAWADGCNIQPFSMNTLRNYIENQDTDLYANNQLRLAACEKQTGKVVGMVDLYNFEPRHAHAWVGIIVSKEMRGKGYGKDILELMHEYVFDFLHLHQLLCEISCHNIASLRLFESAGYTQCGLLKEYLQTKDGYEDVVMMQKIR